MSTSSRPSRPTIQTIADSLGVSPSTVSRALHPEHSRRLAEHTVHRVRSLAAELGYEPNPWARSLRTRRTRTLGVVVPWLTDAPLAEMLAAAEGRAREAGYVALVLSTRDRPEEQRTMVELLLDRRVDGLILATSRMDDESLDGLRQRGIHFVLMNRASGGYTVVRGDDELGGYLATRHLLAQGHRRIGVIAGRLDVSTAAFRVQGYRRAHAEAGVELDPSLIVPSSFLADGGYTAGGQLIGRPDSPSAVFAINDATAIGALAAARDLGLQVPRDLAVIGYNDAGLAAMLPVPLSSIALPLGDIGRRAVELLFEGIGGLAPDSEIFPPRLVVRASTAKPFGSDRVDRDGKLEQSIAQSEDGEVQSPRAAGASAAEGPGLTPPGNRRRVRRRSDHGRP